MRELAAQLGSGKDVAAALDRALAELADELDRLNELGELRLDEDKDHDAVSITA